MSEQGEKPEELPAEYTPPEGWRVLAVGELLQPGDHWVSWEVTVSRLDIQHGDGATVSGGRYIRQIKPEPQPEAEPVQVREGRWRTRHGDIRNVTPTPPSDGRAAGYPWWDSVYQAAWTQNGRYYSNYEESKLDLVEYLGPIEPQIEPQIEPVPQAESDAELQQLREQVLALTLERDRYQSWLKDHHKAGQQAIVEALQAWLRPVLELVAEHPEDASTLAVAVLGFLPGIASRLIEE